MENLQQKLADFKNNLNFSKKNILTFLVIILLLTGVGLGVYLVQQQQQLKSRAAAETAKLSFGVYGETDLGNKPLNSEFDAYIYINTGNANSITGVDVILQYDRSTINPVTVTPLIQNGGDPAGYSNLETTIIPSNSAPSINPDNQTIRYVGVNKGSSSTNQPRTGYFPLFKVTFKAVGYTAVGTPGKIKFFGTPQIVRVYVGNDPAAGIVPVDGTSTAKYTINAPTPTSIPVPSATPTRTPTPTPIPTLTLTPTPTLTLGPTSTPTPIPVPSAIPTNTSIPVPRCSSDADFQTYVRNWLSLMRGDPVSNPGSLDIYPATGADNSVDLRDLNLCLQRHSGLQ